MPRAEPHDSSTSSSGQRRSLLERRWLRVLVGVLWVPVAAEMFLRIFSPVPMLPRYVMAGPHGVRANMPSAHYRHHSADFDVEMRINAQGMRADRDFALVKPPEAIRVAVLGDSFGMGFEVALEETSLAHLERGLATATGRPVEILNFSVSGHGPAEQLVVLESEALRYRPDLVIQLFHATDLKDDMRSGLYRIDGNRLVRAAASYLPGTGVQELLFSYQSFRWLSGECHLYNLLRDKAGDLGQRALSTIRSRFGSTSAPPDRGAGDESGAADDPVQEPAGNAAAPGALTLRILTEMNRVCNEAGSRFMVVSIPTRAARDRFIDRFPAPDESVDYPVVSPISRFRSAKGQMLYHERSHGHLTPLGCRLMGEAMSEAILQRGLVPTARPET